MPPTQAMQRLLERRRRTNLPKVIGEATERATEAAENRRGILQRIGDAFEAVDAPFRGLVAGEGFKSISPGEFNKIVFGTPPAPEGEFSGKELATSLVVSPFNLIPGLGALTKTGRIAQRVQNLERARKSFQASQVGNLPLKLAQKVAKKGTKGVVKKGDTLESITAKLAEVRGDLRKLGAPEALAGTLSEQARAGQRGLVTFGLPLTGQAFKLPVLGGAVEQPIFRGASALGRAIGRTGAARGLRRAFQRTPKGAAGDLLRTLRTGTAAIRGDREGIETIISRDFLKGIDLSTTEAREAFTTLTQDVSKLDDLEDVLKKTVGPPDSEVLAKRNLLRDNLEDVGGVERDAANKLVELNRLITTEQLEAGGRGASAFVNDNVGYVRRLPTAEGREFVRKHNLERGFESTLRRSLSRARLPTTFDPTQLRRNTNLRNLYTADINKWARTKGFKGDFFELDPAKVIAQTLQDKSLSTLNARVLHSFIDQLSTTNARGGIPLANFIAETNLFKLPADVVNRLGGKSGKGGLEFARNIDEFSIQGIQKVLDDAGLGLLEVPQEAAGHFVRQVKPFTDPAAGAGLLRLWDVVNRTMANALTQVFPAFHIRNAIGNSAQMMVGGMPAHLIPVFIGRMMALRGTDELQRMFQIGALQKRAGQAAQLVSDAEAVSGVNAMTRGAKNVREIFAKPFKFGAKKGEQIENTMRGAFFLWARDVKKLTETEAVTLVDKHLFDYSLLTDFEKNIANRTIFFYRWVSNALPWLVQSAFENPKMFRLMNQATSGVGINVRPDPGVPSFLRETGFLPAGQTEQGDRQVIGSLGLPIEELRRLDLFAKKPPGAGPVGLPLSLTASALQKFFSSAVPPIQAGAELFTGRDFFLDRPIAEATRAPPILRRLPEAVTKQLLGFQVKKVGGKERFEMNPLTAWLIRKSPISRFVATAGKLDDPRRKELIPFVSKEALLQMFSGVRISSFDELDQIMLNAQRAVNEDMKNAQLRGEVKAFKSFFIPKEDKRQGLSSPASEALIDFNFRLGKARKLIREQQSRAAALSSP